MAYRRTVLFVFAFIFISKLQQILYFSIVFSKSWSTCNKLFFPPTLPIMQL